MDAQDSFAKRIVINNKVSLVLTLRFNSIRKRDAMNVMQSSMIENQFPARSSLLPQKGAEMVSRMTSRPINFKYLWKNVISAKDDGYVLLLPSPSGRGAGLS